MSGVCNCGGAICSGQCLAVSSDPANCGGCGVTCPGDPGTTPFCAAGVCGETLASGSEPVLALAASGGFVCWSDGDEIFAITDQGVPLWQQSASLNFGLAISGTYAVWGATSGVEGTGPGTITSAVLADADASGMPATASFNTEDNLTTIAADDRNIYWSTFDEDEASLFQALTSSLGVLQTPFNFDMFGFNPPQAMTAQDGRLYWTIGGVLFSVDPGDNPTMLSPLPGDASKLINDGYRAYALSGSMVFTESLFGGAATTLVSSTNPISDIACDGTSLYWVESASGLVQKIPVAGGTITTVSSQQNRPELIAVDQQFVYWVSNGGCAATSPTGTGMPCLQRVQTQRSP